MRIVLVNTVMETSTFPKIGFMTPPYWAAILARKIRDRGHECALLDLQLQNPKRRIPKIPKKYYKNVDVVFVSCMIQSYPQMITVSKFYKARGIKIVLGGWGPTSLYHEAKKFGNDKIDLNEHILQFCDAAVIGEAEVVIDELLADLEQNKLRQNDFYIGDPAKWGWVMPDFSIWPRRQYAFGAIQTQRGCPNDCSFCSVSSVLGTKVREKPVEFARKEIKVMLATHGFDLIFFYDDNIIGAEDGRYAKRLFTMFKSNFPKKRWFSQCTARLLKKPDLMDVFEGSGCALLLFGFESLMSDSIHEVSNKTNSIAGKENPEGSYAALIKELAKRGIEVWGCFIYGFKHDKREIFRRTLDFALKNGILIYQGTFLTPQPGTPLFKKSLGELKYPLTPENWGRYDFMQPTVRRHSNHMDNETLLAGTKFPKFPVF